MFYMDATLMEQLCIRAGGQWAHKLGRKGWRKSCKGALCEECKSPIELTRHHLKKHSRGGPATLENIRILCKGCHPK